MLRDSADAIVVMDFGGRVVAWNRGAQRLYGYTQTEALKLNVRDLMTGDRLDATLEVMRRAARGEAMQSFDAQRLALCGLGWLVLQRGPSRRSPVYARWQSGQRRLPATFCGTRPTRDGRAAATLRR